jgi:hypothetical protein
MQDLTSHSLADEQPEAGEGQAESQVEVQPGEQPGVVEGQTPEETTVVAEAAPPSEVEATPSIETIATLEEKETAAVETSAIEEEAPTPAEVTTPSAGEPPSAIEEETLASIEEIAPPAEEAPSPERETAPPVEEIAPPVEEEAPVPEEETALAVAEEEASAPVEEIAPPVEEEAPVPEEETALAAAEEEAPAPVEEIAPPGEEEAPVPEEEAELAIAEEEAPAPVEKIAPPVEEEAPVPEEETELAIAEEEALPEGPPFGERLRESFASVRERLSAVFGPLGERIKVALRPFGERLSATFAPLRERMGDNTWIYGVIGLVVVLFILALFIPPFSLLQRLGITGYTALTAEADENYTEHPDGIRVIVPATYEGKLRVRLESIPRADFLGFAHSSYRDAVEALPAHLEVKSPFYKIHVRGGNDQQVIVEVDMPAAAEPWETLDLYTWTGESWKWVGSELDTRAAENEHIRAWVTNMPDNLVVVQTGAIPQTISAPLGPEDDLAASTSVIDEINPTGLAMGTDGIIIGALAQMLDVNAYAVMPILREPSAHGPLADVLAIPEIQQAHIAKIVELCTNQGFAGIEIDHRGVAPEERDAYSAFISALAGALHDNGLRLNVVVESPTPAGAGWNTGGYDWGAIGAVADAVKVPFPDDPAAYVEGGEAQQLLAWAKAQVPRYKLRMQVSSLSVEQRDGETNYITMDEALAPFGKVTTVGGVTQVTPNSEVKFSFTGIEAIRGIVPQDAAGTYRIEYAGDGGTTYTVWLGTSANLAIKLQWAQRYHLGGVAVDGIFNPGNAPGIADALAAYRAATTPPTGQQVEVVWIVTSAAAELDRKIAPLTDPSYTWLVVAATDTYTVKATIAGVERGAVEVAVAEATTPTPTPVVAADAAPSTSAGCLKAAFVGETVPDGTKFDKGETFVKSWTLKNSGTCAWPVDTALVKISSQMGGPDSVSVGTVAVGETKEIQVEMTAPEEDGSFRSDWALKASGTQIFEVYTIITVGEGGGGGVFIPSGGFELGGHVRDIGMPYADKMRYAGMNWAKVQVHYGQDASSIIKAAHDKGFKIQLSALGTPAMVMQAGFEQQFANWVAGMAAAGADAIEVWNEPNLDREWANGHIDPAAYTKLLCTCYSAIKAANPSTLVISAATAPTGYYGGCGGGGCDDLPFLQGMYNAGASQCMDYVGAHHNSGATSPSARSGHPADDGRNHHSWYFLPQTEKYYAIFGKQLYYTEMGYASQEGLPTFSTGWAWARGVTNAQQAAWLSEAVQLSINTGMVRCVIVWNIDFPRYGDDPQDGYAIIRPGGSCPACDSLHNVLGSR